IANYRIVTLPAIPLAVTLPPALLESQYSITIMSPYIRKLISVITLSHQRLHVERVLKIKLNQCIGS
ncbi:TPA: hypothetical protein ACSU1Q_003258, partial [Escherichia coli]